MTKETLQMIAKTASEAYFDDDVSPTDAVQKQADLNDLNPDQIERVAHYTNGYINKALMEKNAYTQFPLVRPEEITGESEKTASTSFVPTPQSTHDKTAADDDEPPLRTGGTFSKMASLYGASYVPSTNPEEDARRLLKAAEVVTWEALSKLAAHSRGLDQEKESLYNEVKNSLYEGASPKEVVDSLQDEGYETDMITYVLNRLEADGMVPTSNYDDDGPYSLERQYLKEGQEGDGLTRTLNPDSPLVKAADAVTHFRKHAHLDLISALTCMKVAANVEALTGVDPEAIHEKKAGAMGSILSGTKNFLGSLGKGTMKGMETIEDAGQSVGKWVAEKPLLRSLELGLGGYAAGDFLGRQKNEMIQPKTQLA